MNKKVLVAITLIIALIVGSAVYLLVLKNTEPTSSIKSSPLVQTSPSETNTPALTGKYLDYSEDLVASTSGTRLLFFYAPWCPQCRQLDASIQSSTIPGGITIFKVDYDSHQSLRQKYGVTIQTTVVKIDEKGNKAKSYVAYDAPNFDSVRRELLP